MIELRVCRVCHAEKPITEFKRDRSLKSGYARICRECHNEEVRRYAANHRMEKREREKEYRKSAIYKVWISKYRELHRNEILEYNREYNRLHSEERKLKFTVRKRCPSCRKHFTYNKFYALRHPVFRCPYCGVALNRGKTLSVSNKNIHGFRIKVIT